MASGGDNSGPSGFLRSGSFTKWVRKRFLSSKPPPGPRTIVVGQDDTPEDGVEDPGYPDNAICSSKYNILTFLPKNLFEQFQRVANFYFLCIGVVQLLIDTPVTPLTSILPLVFVISVTAVKQGYEDWWRHKADNEVNYRPTDLVRGGEIATDCRSKDIQVGDIVRVKANEEFPCDLVMLSSADPKGSCFITTANLDGETNLKTHTSIPDTRALRQPQDLWHSHIVIKCNPPIDDLYTFQGVMQVTDKEEYPLGLENILLRGARLKNTDYIYGCAVYTGSDTKMALNSKSKKNKFSQVEKMMNKFLVIYMAVLLVQGVLSTILSYAWEDRNGTPWYMEENRSNHSEPWEFLERFLSFMVLYNYIIPISLYVTIELQKFLGSVFLRWDAQMYDESVNECAMANTSDLNEELGQIEYLFTDKTGTLTENMMEFRQCCIRDRKFQEVGGALCECMDSQLDPVPDVEFSAEMLEFFQVLAVCHTIRVDRTHNTPPEHTHANGHIAPEHSTTGKEYDYQASSPDEKAFVEACCRYGIIYHGTHQDIAEVTIKGKLKKFHVLHTLPFDATRKRMSVIIQDGQENIFLYCKGAEVAILDRVIRGDANTAQEMIDEYAKLGLRTLTIALRPLSPYEFDEYDAMLKEAQTSLVDREKKLSVVYNEIETHLTLLGATAVEDKLQDQVPQTITDLRKAGIKVWVLTGDKEETAVNISHSAGHFHPNMTELRLTQVTSDENCEQLILHLLNETALAEPDINFALVVDGKSLTFALKLFRGWLRELCEKCIAVLCCRMSPLQKAQVVGLIKASPTRPVTAAIGDGANDVSMIQEADVGLAIMGKEGRQAVRNSDYAFAKFCFLRRIILYHGYLYYNRIAVLVQYFFYKNLAWISGQFFYSFYSAYSQQTLYDPFFLTCYNIFFTGIPILIFGIFEQHRSEDILMKQPSVYRSITRNALLSWREFLKWNAIAVWHASVFFFGVKFVLDEDQSIFSTGKNLDVYSFGSLVFYVAVIAINIKLMLETYYWCLPTAISYVFTLASLIVLSVVYNAVFWPASVATEKSMFRVVYMIFDNLTTWLTILLLVLLALLPDVALRVIKDIRWTHQIKEAEERAKLEQNQMLGLSPSPQSKHQTSRTPSLNNDGGSSTSGGPKYRAPPDSLLAADGGVSSTELYQGGIVNAPSGRDSSELYHGSIDKSPRLDNSHRLTTTFKKPRKTRMKYAGGDDNDDEEREREVTTLAQ